MANEILNSGLGDLRATEILAKEILLLLADRGRIANHPALVYAGDAQGRGSATIKQSAVGWSGYDVLSSVAEGSAVSNTALTDASYDVTVARYAKQYQASDLARITDVHGLLTNPASFAADAVQAADSTLVNLVAGLASGFSNSVGSTGVDMSVATLMAAMTQLEANDANGPYLWLSHPTCYGDFRNSLRQETGALHVTPATQEQLALRGSTYKGSFLGMDIVTSSQVDTINAGADYANMLISRGAVIWADATIPQDPMTPAIWAGKVMVEFERDASSALKKIVSNYYTGVVEGIDAAGVQIVADV